MHMRIDELRHSAAHLLAASVVELYPNAKLAIGPSIENGFYYDFDFGKQKISNEDLDKIEKRMKKIVNNWSEFKKIKMGKKQALAEFGKNPYKRELIEEILAEGKEITVYQSGKFRDLCRGGHVDSPNKNLKHFKLLSVAGAYWRGNKKNPMLTRIYGTAFFTKKELDSYLKMLEEAKERDHKKLGVELDLFTFSNLVGGGLPLWTPKGTLMRNILDEFVWELRKKYGYEKVEIPHITKKDLYVISGHWEKFKNELFKIRTREKHFFAIKPMNCPHHTQIYSRKINSYKELPVRYANTTMVYRDEQSGELSGLSRVRSITQDDAHVFCRKSQITDEIDKIWNIIDEFYGACGFDLGLRLSLSDPKTPDKYLGERSKWEESENSLRKVISKRGVNNFFEVTGEAAFYGPKLDFMAKDSLGREWQIATIQLDFNMPENFDLYCIDENGKKERIVMIHAAVMGSIERYMSILIEHFAGKFPVWLSPVQVKILPINERNLSYSENIFKYLKEKNFRVELDSRSETLDAKIRDSQKERVPYMLIIGDREEKNKSLSVRQRDGKNINCISIDKFINKLTKNIENKSLVL